MASGKLVILKRNLWRVFALYIKLRDNRVCFTCGERTEGRNSHAGHFIPKKVGGLELYFHEENVMAQCAKCNLRLQGRQYDFGIKLGKRKVNKLKKLFQANEENKVVWTEEEFNQKIEYYKKKVEEIS